MKFKKLINKKKKKRVSTYFSCKNKRLHYMEISKERVVAVAVACVQQPQTMMLQIKIDAGEPKKSI